MKSSYITNIKELKLNAKEIFHLLEMDAKRVCILYLVRLFSGKKLTDDPIYDGRAYFKLWLMQFDIYNGNADLHFKIEQPIIQTQKIKHIKMVVFYS